ncbi:hypothetical protein IFM89_012530 [Coptis chinensis]|uniref:Uncharacterized protein n=1 Tax=Coptis chinensis TaxID=261450 RepID=A0A835LVA8_9MAGN|nr:hypothetical protein IFM89_012530 [Coptis chinensis]
MLKEHRRRHPQLMEYQSRTEEENTETNFVMEELIHTQELNEQQINHLTNCTVNVESTKEQTAKIAGLNRSRLLALKKRSRLLASKEHNLRSNKEELLANSYITGDSPHCNMFQGLKVCLLFLTLAPAISLTESALKHLNKMRSDKNEDLCLRIGVKQGGCPGMS